PATVLLADSGALTQPHTRSTSAAGTNPCWIIEKLLCRETALPARRGPNRAARPAGATSSYNFPAPFPLAPPVRRTRFLSPARCTVCVSARNLARLRLQPTIACLSSWGGNGSGRAVQAERA